MSLENFKNRKIEWDTVNKNFDQSVQIVSGDVNSRTVTIVITDNGEPINLTGYSVKLVYKYIYNDNSGFVMLTPTNAEKGEFFLTIPTEMTISGSIKSNLILLNENLEQVIVSKSIKFISDDSTVTDLAQEVNSKIDDFTKLLLENMPQVMRSELNDLHAQTESNTSNIELKANLSDMTSLQSAMRDLENEVAAFGITPDNLITIKYLLDAIANNASDSEVAELINSVNVLTSNISLMSDGDYSPKANKTDLESLQSVVNTQSATISAKANQTDLDNLQTDVTSQGIAISTKAEQAEIIQARGGQSSLDVRLDGLDAKYTDLENETTAQLADINPLKNKKIVMFGDSIIDLGTIPSEIKTLSGATEVYNVGFGGCTMTPTDTLGGGYDKFSMHALATAVLANDFTAQTTLATTTLGGFLAHLNTLKAIDFATIDICFISYGTNDFGFNVNSGTADVVSNLTVAGAMKEVVNKLQSKNPNMEIIFTTPIYRADKFLNTLNLPLSVYADTIKGTAGRLGTKVIDLHTCSGINEFNYTTLLKVADKLHPVAAGNTLMAKAFVKHARGGYVGRTDNKFEPLMVGANLAQDNEKI